MSVENKRESITSLKAKFTELTGYKATSDNIYYLAKKDRIYQIALASAGEKCDYWRFTFTRKQTWIDYLEALENLTGGNE